MTVDTEFWKKAWAVRESLTFQQAASIIVGVDPGSIAPPGHSLQPILDQLIDDWWKMDRRENSRTAGAIPRPENADELSSDFVREWMSEHGFEENLIWPKSTLQSYRPYLDTKHPYFSKRLAAAVLAWEAVNEDPELLKGTTPKAALRRWIEKNQQVLGGTNGETEFSDSALDDICLVANWNEKGGASKSVPKRQKS